ncbi:hypothetical protein HYX04_03875, partial [Candidatus Woesearchaeota archaeon]|nr:hypothetical protein [Candidatus Woesearchaeota archaeon]
ELISFIQAEIWKQYQLEAGKYCKVRSLLQGDIVQFIYLALSPLGTKPHSLQIL